MNLEKKLFNKNKIRNFILSSLAAILLSSCPSPVSKSKEDYQNPPNPPTPPTPPATEDASGYDYTTTIKQIASQNIDSGGGEILINDLESFLHGMHLQINAGALSSNTQISVGEVNNPPELPNGLNYIGSAVNLEPDGISFNQPIEIKIPYHESFLSDAGVSDDSNLKLYCYNKSSQSWEKINITSRDTINNFVTANINHFSYYAITGHSSPPPSDLGIPMPGDLLYTTGAFWNKGDKNLKGHWMPGHVGIYVGEKNYNQGLASDNVKRFSKYNVIEALEHGVQYSYYDLPNTTETFESSLKSFSGENIFMGAREPKTGALTITQRKYIVEYIESQIGKDYTWLETALAFFGMLEGHNVKGPNSFNCVGLAEKAYELAGVNYGMGLVPPFQEEGIEYSLGVLTPAEQYNATRPASGKNPINETPVPATNTIIIQPGPEGKDSFSLNYQKGNLSVNGSGPDEFYLRIDNYANQENYGLIKSFIEFTPPLIPSGSDLSNARLKLYCPEGPSLDYENLHIYIKKIISPWIETTSSCPIYDNATIANFKLIKGITEYSIDISSLVQDWINGSPNYGFVLLSEKRTLGIPDLNGFKFYSSDYPDDYSKRPKLEINYQQ